MYRLLNYLLNHLVVHLVYIDKYPIKLYIGITISKFSAISTCLSLISRLHLVNGAQFFKTKLVLLLTLLAALTVPSTKI